MQAPMCKLCGTRHYSGQAHTFAADPLALVARARALKARASLAELPAAPTVAPVAAPVVEIVRGECPVCAERKRREAAKKARQRARLITPTIPRASD